MNEVIGKECHVGDFRRKYMNKERFFDDHFLNIDVILGKTRLSLKNLKNLRKGTIIELDKIAGEPIDVLVNGKFVAKGEVVVIEESFGIRVTEIVK